MDTKSLTPAQRAVFETLRGRMTMHSGRGGWNRLTMEALQRRGLVARLRTHVHTIDWRLTTAGVDMANLVDAELAARHKAQP